tara:strand:+ start:2043 stop:2861 length:819 start_codon:yes stop_codon:yes gene_type:complete
MPELPEVETTVKGLKVIINEKINKVQIHTNKLRFNIPFDLKKLLLNKKISEIRRIAKYIILDLDSEYSIVIHLGMSGRLKINNLKFKRIKHDHLLLFLTNKKVLIFNDTRKFGFVDIVKTSNLHKKKYIETLGIDALSNKLNYRYLRDRIYKSDVPIKQILLNQKIISGIGNIYASEILYDAKISPLLLGKQLNINHISQLIVSIQKILKRAIKFGGSSIRDYRSTDGTLGNFQSNFRVYGKEGKSIGNYKIIKIIQYGRSTFYCPKIQNNK